MGMVVRGDMDMRRMVVMAMMVAVVMAVVGHFHMLRSVVMGMMLLHRDERLDHLEVLW
jgi:hypothetical protein